MAAIPNILTTGYQTCISYVPELGGIKAQVEIICSKALQNLRYSAKLPWMKTASKISLACLAALALRRQYTQISIVDQRLKAYMNNKTADEQKALYRLLAPLRNHLFYASKWEKFKKDCLSLDKDQFESFLDRVLDIQITDDKNDWISPLIENLSVADLRSKLEIGEEEFHAFMTHAESLAKILNDSSQPLEQHKGVVRENVDALLAYIHRAINSFAIIFLRAHDFSPDENRFMNHSSARMHLSFYYQMVEKPYLLIIAVFSFLKAVSAKPWVPYVGTLISAVGTLTVIKLLGIYLQNSKVSVSNGLSNLSERAEKGDLPFVMGRSQEVVEVGSSLNPLVKDIRWVMLVGLSGSGKDAIVQAFSQAIKDGLFPHLKNAQVTEMNTADLKDIGGGSGNLYLTRVQLLLRDIEGREDRVVIFLNEIHTLNSTSGHFRSDLGQQLKTLSDKRVMFVGATTLEEFKKSIAVDSALCRRFDVIFIDPLKKEYCIEVLKSILIVNYPHIPVEEQAIETAFELTNKIEPEIAQPTKAKEVLEKAVRIIMSNLGMNEINQLESSKKLQKERAKLRLDPTDLAQADQTLVELKAFETHTKEVKDKQEILQKLQNLYHRRKQLHEEFSSLAPRIVSVQNKSANSMDVKWFILFKKKA